jgi:hypothetical protein
MAGSCHSHAAQGGGRRTERARHAGRGPPSRAGMPRGERPGWGKKGLGREEEEETGAHLGGGAKADDVEGRRERLGGEREITCVGG